MNISYSPPMSVLCFVTKTNLKGLGAYVRNVAKELYKVAANTGLEVVGPVYWIYNGVDGHPDTEFTLTIAIPITPPEEPWQADPFEIKTLPAFHYKAQRLQGSWELLGPTYGSMLEQIQIKGLQPSGINRELYLRMDFQNPDNHITEIQIGLNP